MGTFRIHPDYICWEYRCRIRTIIRDKLPKKTWCFTLSEYDEEIYRKEYYNLIKR